MKLNLFTDYALRSLMYFCWHRGRTVTAVEIAEYFDISRDHIVKVVQELSRRGFVQARRGRGGGSILARDPEDISIGEVVTTVDGPAALMQCLRANDVCSIEHDCRLRGVFREAQRRMMDYLNGVSLADVAGKTPVDPRVLTPLGSP